MGKTIEIRLSDAQHAALIAEAEASGRHLFDHCRSKLTVPLQHMELSPGLSVPVKQVQIRTALPQTKFKLLDAPSAEAPPSPRSVFDETPDRIDRLEAMMVEMSQAIHNLASPAYIVEPQQPQPADPIDVDSLVSAQFAEAEAQGLTEHVPDEAEQQLASSGVRPLSRRPIPFSAHSAPRHLRELG